MPSRAISATVLRSSKLAFLSAVLTVTGTPGCGPRSDQLQTVVRVRSDSVVVRYEDGRLAEVLNDMGYELVLDQRVKVVENCDGRLHVAVAYSHR